TQRKESKVATQRIDVAHPPKTFMAYGRAMQLTPLTLVCHPMLNRVFHGKSPCSVQHQHIFLSEHLLSKHRINRGIRLFLLFPKQTLEKLLNGFHGQVLLASDIKNEF
ncbi:hypothetical protein, partial [Pseudomonas syringae]|uniref:hypothetical protein n=1 Tax=Pseudomonas syringae TaxID=317 RepID=UPI001F36EA87